MKTQLILINSGRSALKQGSRILGWWADVPLSSQGRRQVLLLGDRLYREHDVTALYASPLKRASETALILSEMLKVVPERVQDLRELQVGPLSNLSYQEAKERYPELIEGNGEAPFTKSLPDAESYTDLFQRVDRTIGRILDENSGGQVLVVTHGGPIVAYLRSFMGFTQDRVDDAPYFDCSATSLHILRFDGQDRTVVCLNDTTHLADDPS